MRVRNRERGEAGVFGDHVPDGGNELNPLGHAASSCPIEKRRVHRANVPRKASRHLTCASHKAAHVGEIEILRDEKAAIGLRRGPNTRVIGSRETFSGNGVDLVTERRER